ncbi:MAG: UbiD family decarboxylase [Desulfobacterales bacterium]|nr:UbiD family decarboxylase [Desulfobacterales bacterium]
MSWTDLRGWLEKVEEMEELKHLDGIDWDEEIGIIRFLARTKKTDAPAVLFDNIKDYPKGYRVLTSALNSKRRLLMTFQVGQASTNMAMVAAIREKMKNNPLIPPRVVNTGPVLENVQKGDDINLFKFPVPKWHKYDAGRYMGTLGCVITRDPEEGWVNIGTYRSMISGKNELLNFIDPGQHARIHRDKYFARGENMPVVFVFGCDPVLPMLGGTEVPYGVSEYDYAGGLKGAPIDVIEGEYTGLPIPATAEIAVEAEVLHNESKVEGPFAEFSGYYGSAPRPEPVVRVKAVMHRNDPILIGLLGAGQSPKGISSDRVQHLPMIKSANIWNQLEAAGVPDVRGVWVHPAGFYFWVVVSIKQRYPGHAKQAALLASDCGAGGYYGRYVIVVDDDVDPSYDFAVLHALGNRTDPERSIDIIRDMRGGLLDVGVDPEKRGLTSKAIINACIPFDKLKTFPRAARFDPALRQKVIEKYGNKLFE